MNDPRCPSCQQPYEPFDKHELTGETCAACQRRARQPSLFDDDAPTRVKRTYARAVSRDEVAASMAKGATRQESGLGERGGDDK